VERGSEAWAVLPVTFCQSGATLLSEQRAAERFNHQHSNQAEGRGRRVAGIVRSEGDEHPEAGCGEGNCETWNNRDCGAIGRGFDLSESIDGIRN
jgi:hypothetical protein